MRFWLIQYIQCTNEMSTTELVKCTAEYFEDKKRKIINQ